MVIEDVVHDGRSPADRRHDHVAINGFSDVGGLVTDGIADVLDRDALAAHDRDSGVPSFVGVPVAVAGAASHLAEPPVELVGRVQVALLVAEDEVVLVPGFAG